MGFAPAGAAASWKQHPGPSGVQRFVNMQRRVGTKAGEWPQRAQEALGQGGDLLREDECILDYKETSLGEGELADDGDEDNWWEQGGVGPTNALSQSLQGAQMQPVCITKAVEGAQMVRRKAQEWSLTAGEEGASVTMVSVAVEETDTSGLGLARLSKGVYVADASVST
ncbi:hypothetical protein NDU88_006216 [Pleurodeles waltl]|uniref:Uncharacterized protein n=1 Tax=Pleurodeles waltl TaxID=8319 RepID=A0AAV7ULH2_PLEWA|nr:hypothetical protein NDU88_006216 [Pleurodeles waltl]